MKTVIYSHNRGNAVLSLRQSLAAALDTREVPIIPANTVKLRGHNTINLINWGASAWPVPHNWVSDNPARRFNILNITEAVYKAGNKLKAFQEFNDAGVSTLEYTQDRTTVLNWLTEGRPVVARTVLRGSGGEGIIIMESLEDFVEAPVYTLYTKKKYEYRVHVFQGRVIDVQQKRHRRDAAPVPAIDGSRSKIRNLANGWVFCREDIQYDTDVNILRDISVNAVSSLGLDFGAVDIIYNSHYNRYYVLEVNTAPGLEGTTLDNYTNAMVGWIREQGQL